MKERIRKFIEQDLGEGHRVKNLDVSFTVEYTTKKPTVTFEIPLKRTYKKRKFKRTGKFSLSRDYTTSIDDIKVMRSFLGIWEREGLLSDEQKKAIQPMKNKFSANLKYSQRVDILRIFHEVRPVNGKKFNLPNRISL